LYTVITLVTGSFWAKPTWGTWWVWDARLISELILLFLYIGYCVLRASIDSNDLAGKYCSLLNMVGLINVPIIHFSVTWWYTLHQGYTIRGFLNNSIHSEMLIPLVVVIFLSFFFYISVVFYMSCTAILIYEKDKNWAQKECINSLN
jgi:heme exporter protein C